MPEANAFKNRLILRRTRIERGITGMRRRNSVCETNGEAYRTRYEGREMNPVEIWRIAFGGGNILRQLRLHQIRPAGLASAYLVAQMRGERRNCNCHLAKPSIEGSEGKPDSAPLTVAIVSEIVRFHLRTTFKPVNGAVDGENRTIVEILLATCGNTCARVAFLQKRIKL